MYKRISSSRWKDAEIVAFAGGPSDYTMLSSCWHSLLPMFDTKTILPLRLVCREFEGTIRRYRWSDKVTPIYKHIYMWRACFPYAIAANLSEMSKKLVDADLFHLQNMDYLDLRSCYELTGATFHYLRGINTLKINGCFRIKPDAFMYLTGVQNLEMTCCKAMGEDAFRYLRGTYDLHLELCFCNHDAAVAALGIRNIQKLITHGCNCYGIH
jgi:hypothetical protein